MNRTVIFAVVRVYRRTDGVLNTDDRAVVEVHEAYPSGERVKFNFNGRDCFGDVINCIRVDKGSQLYQLLKSLAERNVIVHFPPGSPEI